MLYRQTLLCKDTTLFTDDSYSIISRKWVCSTKSKLCNRLRVAVIGARCVWLLYSKEILYTKEI